MADQDKDKRKTVSEYQDLKENRTKNLVSDFDDYLHNLRRSAALKTVAYCLNYANRSGEYDEIDEQVCLRDRASVVDRKLTK